MRLFIGLLGGLWASLSFAAERPSAAELSVWVAEAVVSAYTYTAQNYLADQRHLARYFTGAGWIAYSDAFTKSGLPKIVQDNRYQVSAVITSPPLITATAPDSWQAIVPLLAVYHNVQLEQRQSLQVTLTFKAVKSSQGVRGLAIERFDSIEKQPTCTCELPLEREAPLPAPTPKS